MPRSNKGTLPFPVAYFGPFEIMEGNSEDIKNGNDEDYVTILWFVVPLDKEEFVSGSFRADLNEFNSPVQIILYQIEDTSEDIIFNLGNRVEIGASMELQRLPFSIFADNRAKYPCFYAKLVFPIRLNEWRSPSQEKIIQRNVAGIFGKDKILALNALNSLFASEDYPRKVCPLQYGDVNNFVEQYFKKGDLNPLYQHLVLIDSKTGYEEAIKEYIGEDLSEDIFGFITKTKSIEITTEADLHKVATEALIGVIKHHVENRYWIHAFWNDAHHTQIKGKKIHIPAQPKREPYIQPTLQVLLIISLNPLGVHVERETGEGAGILDFKCLYTTKKGKPLRVPIEFKLAHNKEIEHGLNKQLPAYLTANNSNHGIFLVMWFKDEDGIFFKKPPKATKYEMLAKLKLIAELILKDHGFIITTEIIDASIKPSASRL